jgi:hypothetical protein
MLRCGVNCKKNGVLSKFNSPNPAQLNLVNVNFAGSTGYFPIGGDPTEDAIRTTEVPTMIFGTQVGCRRRLLLQ